MEEARREVLLPAAAVQKALGPMELYNYSNVYNFEKLDHASHAEFLVFSLKHRHWTIYLSAAYIVGIFGAQKYMKDRPAMSLRPLLAAWSSVLAVFSIMGAYRMVPEVWNSVVNYSFHHSACNPNYFVGVPGFWAIAFIISKPYELGDTVFIVLRKQRLMFLHWYHHVTVLVYVWYSYSGHDAAGRWCFAMNYCVHALMYSYYALRAMQFRVPRCVSVAITSLQILQMIAGCGVCGYVFFAKRAGLPCHMGDLNLFIGSSIYFSYLLLFGHFFWTSYVRPKPQAPKKAAR